MVTVLGVSWPQVAAIRREREEARLLFALDYREDRVWGFKVWGLGV